MILKFGKPGVECPCNNCGRGLDALKNDKYTREEIREAYNTMKSLNINREEARQSLHQIKKNGLKGKKHPNEIAESLKYQARIEQLNHEGWPIEITAWANICPDCDSVTEYRTCASHKYIFGYHGPVRETNSCGPCLEAKERELIEKEKERLSKMTNEEIEAEQKENARKTTVITDEFINLEMTKFKDPTPADNMYIMKLINNKGKTIADIE